jgi:hypothetical protein
MHRTRRWRFCFVFHIPGAGSVICGVRLEAMGLTLEFLTGDRGALIAAVKNADFDALYEPPACVCQADLSLHLIPRDLDLLSESLGEVAGLQPLSLRPFLVPAVDGEEGGAFDVKKTWVSYIAGCDESVAAAASERWAEKLRARHPDGEIELTEEMTGAVASLLALCKQAQIEGRDVVHVWFP